MYVYTQMLQNRDHRPCGTCGTSRLMCEPSSRFNPTSSFIIKLRPPPRTQPSDAHMETMQLIMITLVAKSNPDACIPIIGSVNPTYFHFTNCSSHIQ